MKLFLKIFRTIVLLLCVIYIVRFFYINKDKLTLVFNLGWIPILSLCALSAVYLVIHSYRFKIIIDKCSQKTLPFWDWLRIFSQTRFLNMVIPQSGNVYRLYTLKKKYNISYTNYISAFSSFAWMDTCFNLVLASLILLLFESKSTVFAVNYGPLFVMITFVLIFMPVVVLNALKKINTHSAKIIWLRDKLEQVLSTTLINLKDTQYAFKIFFIGLLTLARTILFYYILFRCFDIQPTISVLVIFYTLFKLSAFIVITPGNIGIQELLFGFLSEQLGIGMAEGILICAAGRVISTSIIILFGIYFGGIGVLRNREDFSKEEYKA